MPVIDASIYISLVTRGEDAHQPTRTWYEAALRSGEVMHAPVVILSEVAAAISRGQDDNERARKVAETLKRSQAITLHTVSLSMADRAAVIASEHRIRGCDALYVALAEALDKALFTLDRQQKERGAAVVVTRSP